LKYLKYVSLFILMSSFVFTSCDGLNDPGSKGTEITTPVPVAPLDKSTGIEQNPTFSWTGIAEKLQISISYDFATIKYEIDVTNTQTYSIEMGKLNKNSLYFWRVGKSYGDNQMSWSGSFRFITAP
jgi:hypothetical protein